MKEIITTPSAYMVLFTLLGFVLGFLIRGIGTRRRVEAARAEGAVLARTTVDGDSSLRAQVDGLICERDQLARRVEELTIKSAASCISVHGVDHRAAVANADSAACDAPITANPWRSDLMISAATAAPQSTKPDTVLGQSISVAQVGEPSVEAEAADCEKPATEVASIEASDGNQLAAAADSGVEELEVAHEKPLLLSRQFLIEDGTSDAHVSLQTPPPSNAAHSFFHRERRSEESDNEDRRPAWADRADPAILSILAERLHPKSSAAARPSGSLHHNQDGCIGEFALPREVPASIHGEDSLPKAKTSRSGPKETLNDPADEMPDEANRTDHGQIPDFEQKPESDLVPVPRPAWRPLFARQRASHVAIEESDDSPGFDLNALVLTAASELLGERVSGEMTVANIVDKVREIGPSVPGWSEVSENLEGRLAQRVGQSLRNFGFEKAQSPRSNRKWIIKRCKIEQANGARTYRTPELETPSV